MKIRFSTIASFFSAANPASLLAAILTGCFSLFNSDSLNGQCGAGSACQIPGQVYTCINAEDADENQFSEAIALGKLLDITAAETIHFLKLTNSPSFQKKRGAVVLWTSYEAVFFNGFYFPDSCICFFAET